MATGRTREQVTAGAVRIDVIAEGSGPLLVMLPSSSRDSEDFDEVAAMFAAAGLRVLRPQPRGMGGSRGTVGWTDAARLCRRRGGGDRGAARRPDCRAGACVRPMGRAHAGGRPAGPGARRGAGRGGRATRSVRSCATQLAKCVDTNLPDAERRAALRFAFFAPGHEPPANWLSGWHGAASKSQHAASAATPQEEWWTAGTRSGAGPARLAGSVAAPRDCGSLPARSRRGPGHRAGDRELQSCHVPGATGGSGAGSDCLDARALSRVALRREVGQNPSPPLQQRLRPPHDHPRSCPLRRQEHAGRSAADRRT